MLLTILQGILKLEGHITETEYRLYWAFVGLSVAKSGLNKTCRVLEVSKHMAWS